ncbi:hypothetical protein BC833DRAFT_605807 [Globomyces pollinis-pini]|nr:hypothetical protein BC833DRAFT_605807 [Globomyces pollinis-pini]
MFPVLLLWETVSAKLADCICPLLASATTCQTCLVTNAAQDSVFWSKMTSSCSQKTAAVDIAALWNVTIKAATDSTTTTLTAPPKATSTPSSAAHSTTSIVGLFSAVLVAVSLL